MFHDDQIIGNTARHPLTNYYLCSEKKNHSTTCVFSGVFLLLSERRKYLSTLERDGKNGGRKEALKTDRISDIWVQYDTGGGQGTNEHDEVFKDISVVDVMDHPGFVERRRRRSACCRQQAKKASHTHKPQ